MGAARRYKRGRAMRLLILPIIFLSSGAVASVFYKPLDVNAYKVISPSVIEFQIQSSEYSGASVTMQITNVDFRGLSASSCEDLQEAHCERLSQYLDGSSVKIKLQEYNQSTQMFVGDVFINGDKLSHTMIKQGWYKFDYKQSRGKHLVLMQKNAMCKGLGIWAGKSTSLDTICN